MDPIFRHIFPVTDMAVDRYGRLRPSALLFYAQEIAGLHCTALSLDYDTLARQGLFWAVIRHRVQVTRLPHSGEHIAVETWAMPTTRVAYPRSTVAYDEKGEEVFRSVSLWVLMDLNTRAMVLPAKSGVCVQGTLLGSELAPPNSLVPRPLSNSRTRPVGFTDLDRNGHMNNTRYLDWIDDLLPSAFHRDHPVREFTVCYLSEAREGQELDIAWELADAHTFQVDAHREKPDQPGKQERVFAAMVRF